MEHRKNKQKKSVTGHKKVLNKNIVKETPKHYQKKILTVILRHKIEIIQENHWTSSPQL